jgi:hypothetical protein
MKGARGRGRSLRRTVYTRPNGLVEEILQRMLSKFFPFRE